MLIIKRVLKLLLIFCLLLRISFFFRFILFWMSNVLFLLDSVEGVLRILDCVQIKTTNSSVQFSQYQVLKSVFKKFPFYILFVTNMTWIILYSTTTYINTSNLVYYRHRKTNQNYCTLAVKILRPDTHTTLSILRNKTG